MGQNKKKKWHTASTNQQLLNTGVTKALELNVKSKNQPPNPLLRSGAGWREWVCPPAGGGGTAKRNPQDVCCRGPKATNPAALCRRRLFLFGGRLAIAPSLRLPKGDCSGDCSSRVRPSGGGGGEEQEGGTQQDQSAAGFRPHRKLNFLDLLFFSKFLKKKICFFFPINFLFFFYILFFFFLFYASFLFFLFFFLSFFCLVLFSSFHSSTSPFLFLFSSFSSKIITYRRER
jgi:hypothetical protein